MTKRFQVVVVTLSTCLLAVLMLGTVLGQGTASGDPYRHFAVFSEVISKIKSEYVEEPDMKNVALGALNGLLESIDPFASYLSAEQYKTYLKAKETRKAGVGLVLARRFGYVSVVDALPGSPGDKAALSTGDVLETIGGIGTRDMPLAYAEMLLLGDAGTTVDLTVLRVRRGAEAQKLSLVRAALKSPAATAKMHSEGIGYLQLVTLENGQSKDVASQLAELQKQGARKLVLDLRHNASGSVEEGIALADLFLENGLITYLQGQKVQRQNFPAQASAAWKHPVVVLVNRGTAGGAEVTALALLENKRAEVVGERTYGEAAQRKPLVMDDGSAVIMAVAKYYGPAGKSIPDNAVTPSLVVIDPDGAADSDDDNDPPAAAPKKSDEDQQLKKAVEVLNVGLAAAKQSDRLRAADQGGQRKDGREVPPLPLGPLNVPRPQ
jgi:carboxyl-terminal processing protease